MARLYALCSVPANHIAGNLGWSMVYQDTSQPTYSRLGISTGNCVSSSSLTVYTSSSEIPGQSINTNFSNSSCFKIIYSSSGYSNHTQSANGYLNTNPVLDSVTVLNNQSLNQNTGIINSYGDIIYKSFSSKTYNFNNSRIYNRPVSFQANNSIKFAIGNDSEISGVCFFERKGLFPAGIYVLNVQRFSQYGNVPLKTNRRVWVLNEPTNLISCGTFEDIYDSINLI